MPLRASLAGVARHLARHAPGIVAVCAAVYPLSSAAYVVRELALAELFSQADIVVVGIAGDEEQVNEIASFTRIQVQYSLQGDPPEVILVLTKDPVVELDPDCCVAGRRYLFFLKAVPGSGLRYVSVNGKYGIRLLR